MALNERAGSLDVVTRLVNSLVDEALKTRVADIRIGLGYTAVMLTNGQTGVAFTFRDQAQGGCSVFRGVRPLCNWPTIDLLALLESKDLIEAGVGLACANALANKEDPSHSPGDILEHLALRPDDHVGMVGYFGPLVGPLRERVGSLSVFERVEHPTGMLLPWQDALKILPTCQVALITSSTIINHTVEALLDAARTCREVALVGPSTPLQAEVFASYGVTLLSGVVVKQPAEVLRTISEGGGTRQFSRYVRKVVVRPTRGGVHADLSL